MPQLKDEGIKLGIMLAAFLVILQIAFYKESPLIVIRIGISLFFLFAVPGYLALHPWREDVNGVERLVAGSLLAAAFFIVFAYYLGLAGLNVKYATFIVPAILYAFAGVLIFRKQGKHHAKN